MRTTLTLEDDVADRLKEEMRRTGLSLKAVVNELIRLGASIRRKPRLKPFRIKSVKLGLRPGLSYVKISELLDRVDGPFRR